MIDKLFNIAFQSAYTAIFEVGSVMAVLMLLFCLLDYHRGDWLREWIERKKLDKPVVMALLALIPVDGTLMFQYNLYRKRGIRSGSLLGGIVGIGEEATYLILSIQPLAWLYLAFIKLLLALGAGHVLNHLPGWRRLAERLLEQDIKSDQDTAAVEADKNFHALPDRFRHQMHEFRYHKMGKAFWYFMGAILLIQIVRIVSMRLSAFDPDSFKALGISFSCWLAMLALFILFFYRFVIRLTTRSFGKIFEHEFSDSGDALGDLAETCSGIILLIFAVTFLIHSAVAFLGPDLLANIFKDRAILAIMAGALIGLIPGTGASLVFTTLYFNLAGQPGAMPFAALAACSIALIGDTQLIGRQQLRKSQRVLHAISFVLALVAGLLIWLIERTL